MQPAGKRQLKLEMPPNPTALYSNMVMITHNQHEVFFDFIQVLPNDTRARIQQRIVMTPSHAKMFMQALGENIERYEVNFGAIVTPPRPESLAEQLFKTAQPGEGGQSSGEASDSDDEPKG